MNTHTFDNHYLTCPICQNSTPTAVSSYVGLFTCPYCHQKLVVCKSGHYVRDPFTLRQIMISSALRRQSRPLARIIRDFFVFKNPLLAVVVGSAIVFGMIAIYQQNRNSDTSSPQIEKTIEDGRKSQ
ncbi:MAG: hypothetical protein KME28_04465 [Pelatocladus maniniholoensis HA4357-MV3]|jgi:hypothetical protein|uniref:Uncharacterized protein n=1 Tax=Pelatocladus maniniholoensis HA4357-MV3 TaxID=1117104 RepID=A0A9E3LRZ9_9NOST|nr:hypothetical protein [Pelatocladus maniniholoensis HA4357-MV3]BAZ67122.1 hypothetical protein NIES4106_18760 [Fischerella sp. NIES-4106]